MNNIFGLFAWKILFGLIPDKYKPGVYHFLFGEDIKDADKGVVDTVKGFHFLTKIGLIIIGLLLIRMLIMSFIYSNP